MNFKNPQVTTTLKEELPMVVNGPSGIKANKMVGHIQHILNVQAQKVTTIQTKLGSLKCQKDELSANIKFQSTKI